MLAQQLQHDMQSERTVYGLICTVHVFSLEHVTMKVIPLQIRLSDKIQGKHYVHRNVPARA